MKPLIIRIITKTGKKKVNQMINIANKDLFSPLAIVENPNQLISITNEMWSFDYYKEQKPKPHPHVPERSKGKHSRG